MTRTSGSIGGATPAALARAGVSVPPVENATSTALLAWAAARGRLRSGQSDVARIAFVGDSKTMGAGAGGGPYVSQGAFTRSRPARVAALLAAAGVPVRTDGFFGAAGLPTIPDVLSYDPRRSGFSGWGGGNASLGGSTLSTGNGNPAQFQPGMATDRCSVFFRNGADRPAFTVAKGGESVTVTPSGPVNAFTRQEIVFAARDDNPIVVTRVGTASNLHLAGLMAWDSTRPGVEIANLGVFGCSSSYQADMTSAFAPASALATYAPHLTVVNIGTNDAAQAVPVTTWLANVRTIVLQAKLSGSVLLCWPSVGGWSPTYGSDTMRATWRAALRQFARDNDCLFIDEEALLGGRVVARTSGAFADSVHEMPWAYDLQAAAIVRAIL